ncbi:Uncharacterized protein APZ42_021314 [Daphnia magna]|uniref:SWIM-type domain-containing protein n=1 Tax=Daphnia magna TaxID=35525 RepID=A0A164WSP6_9CRUS|nr:Uncharacterized protein APZ42_021314 [Daphnia magna]
MSVSCYAIGLEPDAKQRYLEKLKLVNVDCPYSISKTLWKCGLDCCPIVPKLSPPDIFIHLVESKSYQNLSEALGAYKGLSIESKQAVKDGWVQEFRAMILSSGFVLIKAKVSPSQALSHTPHQPWAAIAAQGCAAACAHCTCAAGLGEVCNHVAGLLQVCMVSSQIHEEISCRGDRGYVGHGAIMYRAIKICKSL